MQNTPNATFGFPAAYQIRVYSMMNSPQSVAAFLVSAMILLADEGLVGLAVAAIGVPVLALSLARTGWVGLSAGVLMLFVKSRPSQRLTLLVGVVAIALGLSVLTTGPTILPEIRNHIVDRFRTFQDGQTDTSADGRISEYQDLFRQIGDNPFGIGFGAEGGTSTFHERREGLTLDSGILESIVTFGIPVCTAYFIALGTLVVAASRALRNTGGRMAGYFALICAVIAMMPFVNTLNGEISIVGWTGLGLLLSASELSQREALQRRRAIKPRQVMRSGEFEAIERARRTD